MAKPKSTGGGGGGAPAKSAPVKADPKPAPVKAAPAKITSDSGQERAAQAAAAPAKAAAEKVAAQKAETERETRRALEAAAAAAALAKAAASAVTRAQERTADYLREVQKIPVRDAHTPLPPTQIVPPRDSYIPPSPPPYIPKPDTKPGPKPIVIEETIPIMDPTPAPVAPITPAPVRIANRNVTNISDLVPQFSPEHIAKILFENVSAIELSIVERHDTIEGINQRYSIISNLSEVTKKYNAAKQLSIMDKLKPLTSIYPINIQDKIPQEDYIRLEDLDSTYQYLDENNELVTREKGYYYIDTNGDLVIELINLERSQEVEVYIDTNGTIYNIEKAEL